MSAEDQRRRLFWGCYLGLVTISSLGISNLSCAADGLQTHNVFLVTIDGMRSEELFSGADKRLIDNEIGGVKNLKRIRAAYWHDDPLVRRERLMPFVWKVMAKQGQIFGSVDHNCNVWVKNGKYFSYPGYQELLCGFPDETINSNDKVYNKNKTVLEWLHEKEPLAGKVAAFASWDVLTYVINDQRSGVYVNAGWKEFAHIKDATTKRLLNKSVRETPHLWENARFDNLTAAGALEYLKAEQPRVLYLSLDETDDWCHSGRYDLYLESAQHCDDYLSQLWDFAQESEFYRGRTSLIVSVDHGRGDGREGWKSHSPELPGSERVWIAVLGPDTAASGIRTGLNLSQGQVAATVAGLLGYDYPAVDSRIAAPLPGVLQKTSHDE